MDGEQYRQLDSLRRRFFDNYLKYRNDQVSAYLCPCMQDHAAVVGCKSVCT